MDTEIAHIDTESPINRDATQERKIRKSRKEISGFSLLRVKG